ncbi:unnamed protein product [Gongylonema pulchrum]|uniref:Ovule protein n=1 Tax=Gongylonema pulchrum TaxID=637853 RepID=A0A183DRW0_9BILA|nr:unnamed protein product [Gongylonema pulchrum]
MATVDSRSGRRVMYDEKSCCDVRLLRVIIYFFNFLFYLHDKVFIVWGVTGQQQLSAKHFDMLCYWLDHICSRDLWVLGRFQKKTNTSALG